MSRSPSPPARPSRAPKAPTTTIRPLASSLPDLLLTGRRLAPPKRSLGFAHPNIVPYQSFAAADGWFNVAVGNDTQFERLCVAINRPEIAQDERFSRNGQRSLNKSALDTLLSAEFVRRPAAEWLTRLAVADVPAGPINDIAQVFADPQVQARGMRHDLDHAQRGRLPGVACPLKIDGHRSVSNRPPPTLGEHTDEVLTQILGLDGDRLASMRLAGQIA